MRCLERNKTVFYYSLFSGKQEIIDAYGNATGQYRLIYENPRRGYANISAAKGEVQTQQFGDDDNYDKVIVLDNPSTPIDEYTILWVDSGAPQLAPNGSLALDEYGEVATPHDYVVKKVARSLNSVSMAVSKVTVR